MVGWQLTLYLLRLFVLFAAVLGCFSGLFALFAAVLGCFENLMLLLTSLLGLCLDFVLDHGHEMSQALSYAHMVQEAISYLAECRRQNGGKPFILKNKTTQTKSRELLCLLHFI